MVGFMMPHGLLATMFAIAPAVAARRLWLARRRRLWIAGRLCVACGYDARQRRAMHGVRDHFSDDPPRIPPMQRTGAAGIVSFVRTLLGRGSGR